jgi:hypothetical protein
MRSIADIERFMHKYPEFKKQQGMVAKHVALTSHLSAMVDERNLLDLSELEQELACEESLTDSMNRVETFVADPKVRPLWPTLRCLFYPKVPKRTIRGSCSLFFDLKRFVFSFLYLEVPMQHRARQLPSLQAGPLPLARSIPLFLPLVLARGAGREEARRS